MELPYLLSGKCSSSIFLFRFQFIQLESDDFPPGGTIRPEFTFVKILVFIREEIFDGQSERSLRRISVQGFCRLGTVARRIRPCVCPARHDF